MSQVWEVISGKNAGGIIVRESQSVASKKIGRLGCSSFVEEIALQDDRMHYKLLTGKGPNTGWISLRLGDRDLLRCVIKADEGNQSPISQTSGHTDIRQPPLFCAWYSGGFSATDGEKLLVPLIEALCAAGLENTKILHFPDAYDISGKGREPWASYVDRLVEEINKASGNDHRPLILFGHSRGAGSAVTVASRLGTRVKKVYIAACGAMELGKATGWEVLSEQFQTGDDRDLIKWFSSLQPENILLRRLGWETTDSEFQAQIASSKFFSDMLRLMQVQYRDAMYPDPDRDFYVFDAPIMAISPLLDETSQPAHLEGWGLLTSGGFELKTVNAGHMDCLALPTPETAQKIQGTGSFDAAFKDVMSAAGQWARVHYDGSKTGIDDDFIDDTMPFHPVEWGQQIARNMRKVQAAIEAKQKASKCELAELICEDIQKCLV